MDCKEKFEFLALLRKLSKEKQQEFYYMTEGAKMVMQKR